MENVVHNSTSISIASMGVLNCTSSPVVRGLLMFVLGGLCGRVYDAWNRQPDGCSKVVLKRDDTQQVSLEPVSACELGEEDCPVCLECFANTSELCARLPCKHSFHKLCIDKWLQRGSFSCPCCRMDATCKPKLA